MRQINIVKTDSSLIKLYQNKDNIHKSGKTDQYYVLGQHRNKIDCWKVYQYLFVLDCLALKKEGELGISKGGDSI